MVYPNCPKCGEEVTGLVTHEKHPRVLVLGRGGWTNINDWGYTEEFPVDKVEKTNLFECPECGAVLFDNEDNAKAFLSA